MINVPHYMDGYFDLYRVEESEEGDYPVEVLKNQDMRIYYREIAVFDRLRFELKQGGKEVTLKVRIPRYEKIDSHCHCLINGIFHEVYNAAHIINKDGWPETELTLVAPEKNREVKE